MDLKKNEVNISKTVRFTYEDEVDDFVNGCLKEGYTLMETIYYKPPSLLFKGKWIGLFRNKRNQTWIKKES